MSQNGFVQQFVVDLDIFISTQLFHFGVQSSHLLSSCSTARNTSGTLAASRALSRLGGAFLHGRQLGRDAIALLLQHGQLADGLDLAADLDRDGVEKIVPVEIKCCSA